VQGRKHHRKPNIIVILKRSHPETSLSGTTAVLSCTLLGAHVASDLTGCCEATLVDHRTLWLKVQGRTDSVSDSIHPRLKPFKSQQRSPQPLEMEEDVFYDTVEDLEGCEDGRGFVPVHWDHPAFSVNHLPGERSWCLQGLPNMDLCMSFTGVA